MENLEYKQFAQKLKDLTYLFTESSKFQFKKIGNSAKNRIEALRLSNYLQDIDVDDIISPLYESHIISNIAYKSIEKYNSENIGDEKTMMMLETRLSNKRTTNRKSHMENTEYIAVRIANALGLNEHLIRTMARFHDIGHTPLGHNGERYLSNVREDSGIGPYYHAALGAMKILFENNTDAKIIHNLRIKNPNISQKELRRVYNSLWIIADGILSHTGETSKLEVRINPNKTRDDFYSDLITSFVEPNYRSIPATLEGLVIQQADKISSIITDFSDGINEGFLTTPGPEYYSILNRLGVSKDTIEICVKNKDCSLIVNQVQETLIQDTIRETKDGIIARYRIKKAPITRQEYAIKKSDRITTLLNELRNLNYKDTVANIVLQEDADIYQAGFKILTEKLKQFTLREDVTKFIEAKAQTNKSISSLNLADNELKYEDYATFLQSFNKRENKFFRITSNKAIKHNQTQEMAIARDLFLKKGITKLDNFQYIQVPDGCNGKTRIISRKMFFKKYKRLQYFLDFYSRFRLQKDPETSKLYILNTSGLLTEYSDSILIKACKKDNIYPSFEEARAYQLATSYIASLNAEQVLQLFLDFNIINKSQYASLTRSYQSLGQDYIQTHKEEDPYFKQLRQQLVKETKEAKQSSGR